MLEDHPFVEIIASGGPGRRLPFGRRYFSERPYRWAGPGTYATARRLRHNLSYDWSHRMSTVLNALLDAGLHLDSVREFPFTYWRRFPSMKKGRDGFWHLVNGEGSIPLMWSVRAHR